LRTGAFRRDNWIRNFSFRNAFGIFALRTGAFGHEKQIRNEGFSFTNALGGGCVIY
jgi:GDP-D-mannose dehydratase